MMENLINSTLGSARYKDETKAKVRDVKIQRTFDFDGKYSILIEWNSVVEGINDLIGFNVYKSIDGKEWVKLNDAVITGSSYLDSDAKLFIGQDYYYKVTFVSVSQGESLLDDADSVSFELQKDKVDGMNWRLFNITLEQIRRLGLVLRHTGEEVYLVIRQFVGQKCRRCYDFTARKAQDPRCPVCFGTGIEKGFRVYEGRMYFEPATLTITRGIEGFVPAYMFRTWTLTFPILNTHDFIIRKRTGERYIIDEVTRIINQGFLIMQQCRVSLINKDHPYYSLEVE